MESNHSRKTGIRGWGIARRALAFRNYFHALFKINMTGLGRLGGGFRNHGQFRKDLRAYRRLQAASTDARIQKFPVLREEISPYLRDMEMGAGVVGGDYFYQDIWAARKIHERLPDGHVDIGSRIDGFITHLLVFMENVTVMDVRPMKENVPGLRFIEADCTTLDMLENGSVNSLSSLHAAEHFGLGRYGDPVDPAACFTFMDNLARVLKPGGRLYFSVPIGRERVVFNGKRVFDPHTIIESFPSLELVGFSGYSASQGYHENVQIKDWKKHDLKCGFFEFGKSKS